MIRRIKVNTVLGSSLLLFEGSKRPLLTFLTLCCLSNFLETVTNANAMYTMKTPNADNNSCLLPRKNSINLLQAFENWYFLNIFRQRTFFNILLTFNIYLLNF